MGDMWVIKVVYHTRPYQAMRAVNYYSMKPKIMGKPLTANTVLFLPEETIRENQLELEPMMESGIISITDTKGTQFQFDRDATFSTLAEDAGIEDLPSLEALLAGVDAEAPPEMQIPPELSEVQTVALDAEGLLPVDPLGDLRLPDELPGEIREPPRLAIVPGVDIPPEMPTEERSTNENDRFFSDLKKYVGTRRKTRSRKTKVAG